MKRTLIPMLALAAILGFSLARFSAQESTSEDTPQLVSATIKQVDTTGNSIMVETTEHAESWFIVDSQTKITVNGKKASLADLKEGQPVKIAFNKQGKALSIDV